MRTITKHRPTPALVIAVMAIAFDCSAPDELSESCPLVGYALPMS